MEKDMNTATFEALRDVGFDEKQAVVLATAIPDVERPLAELRTELKGDIKDLRSEMLLGFADLRTELKGDIERSSSGQTKWMAGIAVAMLIAIIGSRFIS